MKRQRRSHWRAEISWGAAAGLAALAVCAVLAILLAGYLHERTPEGGSVSTMALPTAQAALAPAPTPLPTPTPAPWSPPEGAYTIAWMSDTQYYSKKYPDTFRAMTRFLRDERERLNLQYVIHTGDIVHNYNDEAQWAVAVDAMRRIREIPHGVLAGNHDMGGSAPDFSYYSKYFGEAAMREYGYYGDSYEDNRGHYDLLDIGGTPYLFVYMSYAPDDGCIRWLNSVFAQYPQRVGVLCLHDYFKTDLTLGNSGKRVYEDVVKQNPNLYLVLCGHRYAVACREAAFDDDGDGTAERTVYQMISNYQAAGDAGGSGYLRLMQVDEGAGMLHLRSYSPLRHDFSYFDDPATQEERYPSDPAGEAFSLPIPWLR